MESQLQVSTHKMDEYPNPRRLSSVKIDGDTDRRLRRRGVLRVLRMRRVHGVGRVLRMLRMLHVLYVRRVLDVLRVRMGLQRLVGTVVGQPRVGVVVHAHHRARRELVDVTVQ